MEREGLVIRSVDPADRRVRLVDITEAGRVLRVKQRQSQHARIAEVLDTLPPEDEMVLEAIESAAEILSPWLDPAG
jgi:DNA-binding MarR family transcriptional regulator